MAEVHVFENVAQSLLHLTVHLASKGELVSPRGKETIERRNVTIVITDPTHCLSVGIGRGMNVKLGIAETLQLIGGFSDPARFTEIAPNTTAFLTGGSFSGAYGPRIRPQMQKAVLRLLMDSSTRQAVVTIWDPLHDQQDGIADIPCTISFNWHVRNGKLHMTTHMRSNDIWWGWTYDAMQFCQLQCTIANLLGLEVGEYTHLADSLHMYTSNLDDAKKLTYRIEPATHLHGLGTTQGWPQTMKVAQDIFYDRLNENTIYTDTEMWMHRSLHGTS